MPWFLPRCRRWSRVLPSLHGICFTISLYSTSLMPESKEVLPKSGLVVSEKSELQEILCKPKIIPLKSITLQKLEEMEVRNHAHRNS